ncbi:hypothetical protein [Alsobacter sp. R-9]
MRVLSGWARQRLARAVVVAPVLFAAAGSSAAIAQEALAQAVRSEAQEAEEEASSDAQAGPLELSRPQPASPEAQRAALAALAACGVAHFTNQAKANPSRPYTAIESTLWTGCRVPFAAYRQTILPDGGSAEAGRRVMREGYQQIRRQLKAAYDEVAAAELKSRPAIASPSLPPAAGSANRGAPPSGVNEEPAATEQPPATGEASPRLPAFANVPLPPERPKDLPGAGSGPAADRGSMSDTAIAAPKRTNPAASPGRTDETQPVAADVATRRAPGPSADPVQAGRLPFERPAATTAGDGSPSVVTRSEADGRAFSAPETATTPQAALPAPPASPPPGLLPIPPANAPAAARAVPGQQVASEPSPAPQAEAAPDRTAASSALPVAPPSTTDQAPAAPRPDAGSLAAGPSEDRAAQETVASAGTVQAPGPGPEGNAPVDEPGMPPPGRGAAIAEMDDFPARPPTTIGSPTPRHLPGRPRSGATDADAPQAATAPQFATAPEVPAKPQVAPTPEVTPTPRVPTSPSVADGVQDAPPQVPSAASPGQPERTASLPPGAGQQSVDEGGTSTIGKTVTEVPSLTLEAAVERHRVCMARAVISTMSATSGDAVSGVMRACSDRQEQRVAMALKTRDPAPSATVIAEVRNAVEAATRAEARELIGLLRGGSAR